MSKLYDEMIAENAKQDAIWQMLAVKNGWKCDRCGRYIESKEEHTTYYLTKHCGYCEHVWSKYVTE